MIYDDFANFDRYRAVAPEVWDRVKSFLIKASQSAAPGRFQIVGDDCFANVAEYETGTPDCSKLEVHDEYLDIQLTMRGRERIHCRDCGDLEEVVPYSLEKDIAFYRMTPDNVTDIIIGDGKFAVFFPGEGHLPGCEAEGPCRVLKIIVKINRRYLR
ncbi:MAG: YhcH/YjgK/YiaL family protein [Victivallaceae bacterium]|nr:YhcH/YjgK/YiaL family protein [Victivallaceae bacterium]